MGGRQAREVRARVRGSHGHIWDFFRQATVPTRLHSETGRFGNGSVSKAAPRHGISASSGVDLRPALIGIDLWKPGLGIDLWKPGVHNGVP